MYIFGGFEELIDQFSCDVHCLDLRTMQWHFIHTSGAAPSFRDFREFKINFIIELYKSDQLMFTDTATVINNRMYIYGGRGDVHAPYHSQEEVYCPKIVYLDLDKSRWITPTVTGKIPIGRRSHSACK